MKKYLMSACVLVFTVIVLVGIITIANWCAMSVEGWWRIPTFFGVLTIGIVSLMGYMYSLKYSN